MNSIEAMKALLCGKRIRQKGPGGHPYIEVRGEEFISEFGGCGVLHGYVEYEEVSLLEEIDKLRQKGALMLEELDKINKKITELENRR